MLAPVIAIAVVASAQASSFAFSVNWTSGGVATSLPTANFSVRKLEAIVWEGRTYAYCDVVNYSDYYYPDSFSSEVGVFSSADGRTHWQYHGIVVPRGPAGGWDGGGIASPGAAVAPDGTVLIGYAAEKSPAGGINRGIGLAVARHPLGPFTKQNTPIASPTGVCGGSGRCDDVVMQARPGEVHLYHSVKGGAPAPGDGIRHRMSRDNGRTWSNSSLVLSTKLQPGTNPAETIAGKFFPSLDGGRMVLVTDHGPGNSLHAYVSAAPSDMRNFVAAAEPSIEQHPPDSKVAKGFWANLQIGFVADGAGEVVGVTYALWGDEQVWSAEHKAMSRGYTHTVYRVALRPTTNLTHGGHGATLIV